MQRSKNGYDGWGYTVEHTIKLVFLMDCMLFNLIEIWQSKQCTILMLGKKLYFDYGSSYITNMQPISIDLD